MVFLGAFVNLTKGIKPQKRDNTYEIDPILACKAAGLAVLHPPRHCRRAILERVMEGAEGGGGATRRNRDPNQACNTPNTSYTPLKENSLSIGNVLQKSDGEREISEIEISKSRPLSSSMTCELLACDDRGK